MPWRMKVYIPTIVTTAKLLVCDFDAKDIDESTGEVPFDKTSLAEVPQLVFEYALPRHLQFGQAQISKAYGVGLDDLFTRMHVLVVQSQHFASVLHQLHDTGLGAAPDATTNPVLKSGGRLL